MADDDLAPLNPQLIPPDGKVCQPNPFPYPLAGNAASPGHAPVSTPLTFPSSTSAGSGDGAGSEGG